ncbi:response regulator [Paracidovorax konjaci]|uniref:Two-component system, OmpR family, response regulator TctD n=1 Tax=Paracidovorax konjaci TaxID=32040 RepID=A0A1I1Y2H0_9BURK|nr:response regulator [Paracidovorax konjaci]SFE13756.1 two-component system, OmpR family, response regulator TctD [Paracidovorax konjaci]
MRLLLAEDESDLAGWLVKALAQGGNQVDWVADGRLVRRALRAQRYDALILDLGLPGLSGEAVLQGLREDDDPVPILILTARDTLAQKVSTLRAGADDFLAKPFEVEELEARLLALVRRARGRGPARWTCGRLAFDAGTRRFDVDREPLALTAREHAVLSALVQSGGEPLGKRDLAERVFAGDSDVHPEAIEVLVHRLRKRLAGTGAQISTLRGLGYLLEAAE